MGLETDGIRVSDSLKFKPNSPICDYLDIRSQELELVKYLPGNVLIAGGITVDAKSYEKFNSVMFDVMMPILQDKIKGGQVAELRSKYEAATREILSCFGDEIAFAITTRSDKMMPRVVYIFEVVDEDKARETIGNIDYLVEISKPFYQAFGMDFQMTQGPTQRYTGVQIESFEMDLSKMASLVPNAATIYPERTFLWHAFVDDKMVYAMSLTADTIKEAIDAIKGRTSSIAGSPGFEDIDIRLPSRKNAVVYISPSGYMGFAMNMVMASQGMPAGTMATGLKSDMSLAVATNIDRDGVRNFTYLLSKELRELVGAGLGFGQMMKAQQK